jgi:hypothetical protein
MGNASQIENLIKLVNQIAPAFAPEAESLGGN